MIVWVLTGVYVLVKLKCAGTVHCVRWYLHVYMCRPWFLNDISGAHRVGVVIPYVGVVFSWPLCGSGLLLVTVWEWSSLGYMYLVYDSSLAQGTCACTCSLTREG